MVNHKSSRIELSTKIKQAEVASESRQVGEASDTAPGLHLDHKTASISFLSFRPLTGRQLSFRQVHLHCNVPQTYHRGTIFDMAAAIAHNIQVGVKEEAVMGLLSNKKRTSSCSGLNCIQVV